MSVLLSRLTAIVIASVVGVGAPAGAEQLALARGGMAASTPWLDISASKAAPKSKVPPVADHGERPVLTSSGNRGSKPKTPPKPTYQPWMSTEVADAWASGYLGQGTSLMIVDDFSSRSFFSGNLGAGVQSLRHGEWTRLESAMVAPSATIGSQDFSSGRAVPLARTGLTVVNLSYGLYAKSGLTPDQITWSAQESSLVNYAGKGTAVISKAAGNDAIAIGGSNRAGNTDYLNVALIGKPAAILVGALDGNGTPDAPTTLASYSNFAGSDPAVQQQFLTVGVRGDLTKLYGTSFAAPVVSGYAAILGSKFTSATPTQITSRLLDTARTDTISDYSADRYGRGEASIARALAPSSIN